MGLLSRFKEITGVGKLDRDLLGDGQEFPSERSPEEFGAPVGMAVVRGKPLHEMVRGMKPQRSIEDTSAAPMRHRILGLDSVEAPVREESPRAIRRPLLGMAEVRATPMEAMVRQPAREVPRQEPVVRMKPGDPADGAESLARVPRTKDLKAVTDMMLAMFGKAPDAEVMTALGRADGRETDAAPPAPGAKRDRWIAERVAIAFDPRRDYMTHSAHSQEDNLPLKASVEFDVAKTLRHEYEPGRNLHAMAAGRRARLSANITDFMQDGPRLDQRVALEREHLERRTQSEVERRFAMSPISSMKEMPQDSAGKRAWIEDALRAEHAAARAGMMHGPSISIAANAERGQTPYAPGAQMPRVDWSRLPRQEADIAKEASQLDRLPDQGLRSRFRDVPGVDRAPIPAVGSADRRTWIEVAVQAQRIRDTMPRVSPEQLAIDRAIERGVARARQPLKDITFDASVIGKGPGKGAPPPAMAAAMSRQNGM